MTSTVSRTQRATLAEGLAYWYLRLNGFLTIENFVLHRESEDRHYGMRTDADLVGVRFNHRDEQGMRDEEFFRRCKQPMLVIVEVTSSGRCKINGPWTKPERENVNRLLRALGPLTPENVALASASLYETGKGDFDGFSLQLIAVGMRVTDGLQPAGVLQLTWEEVLSFIHNRFRQYWQVKKDHRTWRTDGQELWERSNKNKENFVKAYLEILAVPKNE